MGGTIEVQLVRGRSADVTIVEDLFARYEQTLTRFRTDSELSRLNASQGSEFRASPVLFEAVSQALSIAGKDNL